MFVSAVDTAIFVSTGYGTEGIELTDAWHSRTTPRVLSMFAPKAIFVLTFRCKRW